MYEDYDSNPIIISRNSMPIAIDSVPFPAVTICNMNLVKKSFAEYVLSNG